MELRRSLSLIASSLLGVLSVAGLVTGAFMLFGAWVIRLESTGHGHEIGTGAAILVGGLLIGFAGLAAIAAREEWRGAPHGRVLGLIVGLVAALAAATALLVGHVGESRPLLYVAIAIAATAIVALLAEGPPVPTREHGAT
jgi:hypothetical protein